jgi:aldehyde dehydrogenase (NAD+)
MSATAAGPGDQRTALRWDYSPAPEATDHVRLRDRYGLFVDGEFVEPAEGGYAPTINPATEEPLADVAQATAADVERAVAAARGGRAGGGGGGPLSTRK